MQEDTKVGIPSDIGVRSSKHRVNIVVAIIVTLVVATVFIGQGLRKDKPTITRFTNQVSGVVVKRMNTAFESRHKVPEGFPTDIPLELAGITESYSANYTDHGVIQYTVSYASTRSRSTI